ncbi:hypothetical protein NKH18_33395 [Streptomyces sp. M10(2022)]
MPSPVRRRLHRAGPPPRAPEPTTKGTGSLSTHGYSATDAGWIQLVIPMTDQALGLLDLAPARAHSPGSRPGPPLSRPPTAPTSKAAPLRDRMGLPTTNVHEGHTMPGMVIPRTSPAPAPRRAGLRPAPPA